jgi:hypothetical protein
VPEQAVLSYPGRDDLVLQVGGMVATGQARGSKAVVRFTRPTRQYGIIMCVPFV